MLRDDSHEPEPPDGSGGREAAPVGAERRRDNDFNRIRGELSELGAAAAHDLVEPVAVIMGYSRMLRRSLGDDLDPEAGRLLETIDANARRLHQMLGSVRDYVRLGRNGARAQVDLGAVAQAQADRVAAAAADRDVEVTVGRGLPTVDGDPALMALLIYELVSNALAHGGEGLSRIAIDGHAADGWAEITVSDDGRGLNPTHAERALKLFARIDPSDVSTPGAGLAFCRKVAALHGGWLRVEPDPGPGSVFVVRMPLDGIPG